MARLAVDIGGTFTDVALQRDDGGRQTAKVPTTPDAPERGVLAGVRLALAEAGVAPATVTGVVHGTTLAANALIERKGARTALLCTEGFRDTLRLAYENRYDQYDIWLDKPEPLVPRHLTFPVPERMDAGGRALRPLDEAAAAPIAAALEDEGVEALAIGLLHAYANPAHERRLRELLAARLPGLFVTLASEVCPELREYERLTTAVCNAYVQPAMARYLGALDGALKAEGIAAPLLLMTSGGGICALETATRFPIRLVESGPSAGAILAAAVAARRGEDQVLSYDMGGTTAKVCLIEGARPQRARTFEIARRARFAKGSGLPLRIPAIEMIEIGAGGGSIARCDDLGRIAVGPDSAASCPGPACYGHGGSAATVTDADLVLGRLDGADFADGRMTLDRAAAEAAIAAAIARPLGLAGEAAALGISEVVDEAMANAARVHAVERGKDLRRATMIAFGGAGPLHACRMAAKLGIARIVVPADPGVASAVGLLTAPTAHEVTASRYMTLAAFDAEAAEALLAALAREARGIVRQGAPSAPLAERRSCFMRYLGQGHEIEIPLPCGRLGEGEASRLRRAYDDAYRRRFGRSVPGMDVEVLGWKLAVRAATPGGDTPPAAGERDPATPRDAAAAARRPLVDPAAGRGARVPVYRRAALVPGARFRGPCLVAEGQTTTVVTAAFAGRIDEDGDIVLERVEGP